MLNILQPATASADEWAKWRMAYKGGVKFRDTYLYQLPKEGEAKFTFRKKITPIPNHAATAIDEVKDSIIPRLHHVERSGGPDLYHQAVAGEGHGIDRTSNTMLEFLSTVVLPELLLMGEVGILTDNIQLGPDSTQQAEPFSMAYRREDILDKIDKGRGRVSAVKLRDYVNVLDDDGFVSDQESRVRVYRETPEGVLLTVRQGDEESSVLLDLEQVPFTYLALSRSLMENVADYQISLLNLVSMVTNYGITANFGFYTEQRARSQGDHLDRGGKSEEIEIGDTQGRTYGKDLDRPGFIAPPAEPAEVNMKIQARLSDDIRRGVNLNLDRAQVRETSAESKRVDQQTLESGLSAVGLLLERAENHVADDWAMYIGSDSSTKIKYPRFWGMRSEAEVEDEVAKVLAEIDKVPSITAKRALLVYAARLYLSDKVTMATMEQIEAEINAKEYIFGDRKLLIELFREGVVPNRASEDIFSLPEGSAEEAAQDRIERLKKIAEAQTKPVNGVPDTQPEAGRSRQEKKGKRSRGDGR